MLQISVGLHRIIYFRCSAISSEKEEICKILQIVRQYLQTECKYHAAKQDKCFTLRTHITSNHKYSADGTSHLLSSNNIISDG